MTAKTPMPDDLELPEFLNRKKNPQPVATDEEIKALAAKAADRIIDINKPKELTEADQKALDEIEAQKKAKTSNRIARLKEKKQMQAIPEKFRAWDPVLCQFYDIRNPKEDTMTTKMTKAAKKPAKKAPAKKKAAPKKAPAKKAAPAKAKGNKRDSGLIEKVVGMASRPNGVNRKELIEATGWQNAGWNTILAKTGATRGLKFVIDKSEKPTRYKLTK